MHNDAEREAASDIDRRDALEQGARRPLCGDRSRCDEAPLPPALIAVDLEPHLAKVTA
jgi:hypothetical protein